MSSISLGWLVDKLVQKLFGFVGGMVRKGNETKYMSELMLSRMLTTTTTNYKSHVTVPTVCKIFFLHLLLLLNTRMSRTVRTIVDA